MTGLLLGRTGAYILFYKDGEVYIYMCVCMCKYYSANFFLQECLQSASGWRSHLVVWSLGKQYQSISMAHGLRVPGLSFGTWKKIYKIILLRGKKTYCNSQMHVPYQLCKCHCTHISQFSQVIKGWEINQLASSEEWHSCNWTGNSAHISIAQVSSQPERLRLQDLAYELPLCHTV